MNGQGNHLSEGTLASKNNSTCEEVPWDLAEKQEADRAALRRRRLLRDLEQYCGDPKLADGFDEAALVELVQRKKAEWEVEYKRRREHEGYERRLKAAEIPPRHAAKLSLALAADSEWGRTYAKLAQRLGTGFIVAFVGIRGTGKTQMAVCLIAEACRRSKAEWNTKHLAARYVTALDLFREFRACYAKDGPAEKSVFEGFVSAELLVIDDAHERSESELARGHALGPGGFQQRARGPRTVRLRPKVHRGRQDLRFHPHLEAGADDQHLELGHPVAPGSQAIPCRRGSPSEFLSRIWKRDPRAGAGWRKAWPTGIEKTPPEGRETRTAVGGETGAEKRWRRGRE